MATKAEPSNAEGAFSRKAPSARFRPATRLLYRCFDIGLKRARAMLMLCAILLVLSVSASTGLKLDLSVFTLAVDETDSGQETRTNSLVIVLENPQGIFSDPGGLASRLRKTGELLLALGGPEPAEIESLAHSVLPVRHGNRVKLGPLLCQQCDMDGKSLQETLTDLPLVASTLVSKDATRTLLLARVPTDVSPSKLQRFQKHVDQEFSNDGWSVRAGGDALLAGELVPTVTHDILLTTPLLIIVLWCMCCWLYRSAYVAGLIVGESGIAIALTAAFAAVSDIPVTLTSALIPCLIVALSVADNILILSHIHSRTETVSNDIAIRQGLVKSFPSVALAALTTAGGLFSLALVPIPAIKDFALLSAFATLASFGVSFTFLPAALSVRLQVLSARPMVMTRVSALAGRVLTLADDPTKARSVVFASVVLAVAAGAISIAVPRDDNWQINIPRHSPTREIADILDREFAGSTVLNVKLREPQAIGDFDTDLFTRFAESELAFSKMEGVTILEGKITDSARFLSSLRSATVPVGLSRTAVDELLGDKALLAQIGQAMEFGGPVSAGTSPTSEDNISLLVRNAGYRNVSKILSDVEDGAPNGLEISYSGPAYDSYRLVDDVLDIIPAAIMLSLLCVGVALALCATPVRLVLGSLTCIILAGGLVLSLHFALGGKVGIAASLYLPIVLSVGVNACLHLVPALKAGNREHAIGAIRGVVCGGVCVAIALVSFALVSQAPTNVIIAALLGISSLTSALLASTILAFWAKRGLMPQRSAGEPRLPKRALATDAMRFVLLLLIALFAMPAVSTMATAGESDMLGYDDVRHFNDRLRARKGIERAELTFNDSDKRYEIIRVWNSDAAGVVRSLYVMLKPELLLGTAFLMEESKSAGITGLTIHFPAGEQTVLEVEQKQLVRGLLGSDFKYVDLAWTLGIPNPGKPVSSRGLNLVAETDDEVIFYRSEPGYPWPYSRLDFDDPLDPARAILLSADHYSSQENIGRGLPSRSYKVRETRCHDGLRTPTLAVMTDHDTNTSTVLALLDAEYDAPSPVDVFSGIPLDKLSEQLLIFAETRMLANRPAARFDPC